MKLNKTLGTALLGSLVAAASFNELDQQGQGAIEVEGFAKKFFAHDSRHVDNGELYGLGLGYFLTDSVELELSHGVYSNNDAENRYKHEYGHDEAKGSLTSLDALYHFGQAGDTLRPYLSAGLGYQNIGDIKGGGRDHNTLGELGAGFKWYVSEHFFVKPGVDYTYAFNDHKSEWYAGVGIGLNFGGEQAPVAAPEPTPEPEPVPETVRVELDVKFDFDKSKVKPQYYPDIRNVADFMQQYPQTTTVVEGHTDSIGTDAYNQKLSERRANAVRDVLVNQYGISVDRVSAVGYGESRPVADNSTAEGRAINRRVEAAVEAQKMVSGDSSTSGADSSATPEAAPETSQPDVY